MCELAWDLFYFPAFFLDCYNVKTDTVVSSETSITFYQSTRHNNQKIHSSWIRPQEALICLTVLFLDYTNLKEANRFLKRPVLFVVEAPILFIQTILQFWKKTTVYSCLKKLGDFIRCKRTLPLS